MSKLHKFKEWLTVEDAAAHLSGALEETVSEVDVLRLGLDGYLKLSVYFVNGASARLGKMISEEQTENVIRERDALLKADSPWRARLKELGGARKISSRENLPEDVLAALATRELVWVCADLHIDGDQYLRLAENVTRISGVWDLTMMGAEALDVEHRVQQLISGVDVTGVFLEGPFVESSNGDVAQIHDRFSKEQLNRTDELLADIRQKKGEEPRQKVRNRNDEYYPAGGLPTDSLIVVRPAELSRFLATLTGAGPDGAGQVSRASALKRENNNLLRIIGAMLTDKYAAETKDGKGHSKLAGALSGALERHGVQLADDTIAKQLTAAREMVLKQSGKKS